MTNPTYAAERVLDEIPITCLQDLQFLDEIAWKRGALVREKYLAGAEARLVVGRKRAIITVSTAVMNPRRRRFGVSHEIGHLEMHRWDNFLILCTSQDINDQSPDSPGVAIELEANQFASALLLPGRFFAPLCKQEDPSLDHISQLADLFNVSLTATALRYTSFCEEPIALVYSQSGYIKWFRSSKEFEELGVFIDVHARLDPTSQAALLFQERKIPRAAKRVVASTWFTPGHYSAEALIQEQSWAMPTYDAVLTLLWVDDDLEEDS